MARKQLDEELLEDSHIFLHPVRYWLLELLVEKPMHINALASALGMERRLVTYHLATLEEHGFVTSKYEILEEPRAKGKALRVYTVTDKVERLKRELKRVLWRSNPFKDMWLIRWESIFWAGKTP
jgi:DNA-binding transcriptional ArsR family regulator